MELAIRKPNKSFDAEGVQHGWDATSITLAQTCLRKYYYQMLEGWTGRGLSVHLRFGQHYATALEHYFKWRAEGADEQQALLKTVRETLLDTWDRETCSACNGSGYVEHESGETMPCIECGATGKTEGHPWDSLHTLKSRENLIRSIIWYVDHFSDDPTPVVILSDGRPAVEHSFQLPVDNGITFSGHLDRLVTYADKPWIMDQKTTTSTLSPHYYQQFKPNTQMSMYSFAGKAVFGVPVAGVIIDAAQIAVGFTRFERGFTTRTESELNEWYDGTMHNIELARTATREKYFPMNPSSCNNYGGCPFIQVCSKPPEVRLQFLKADFDQTWVWDPMTPRA